MKEYKRIKHGRKLCWISVGGGVWIIDPPDKGWKLEDYNNDKVKES